MAPLKLYGHHASPRVFICEIVAAYAGVEIELVETNPTVKKGNDDEPFKSQFPFGLIPGLQDGDFFLSESVAVVEYILNSSKSDKAAQLVGTSAQDKAAVLQWLSWSTSNFGPALGGWFAPLRGSKPYIKKDVEACASKVRDLVAILEKILHSRTFLVGERITAADLYVASWIKRGCDYVLDQSFVSQFPNVFRHYQTVMNQPTVVKVMGPVGAYIEKAIEAPKAAPKAAKEPKAAAAPAAAPKPKAAAKPKDDEEDDDMPAEPKAKHPVEALGAPKAFPFDEWKRQYSNNDTNVAMDWLAEHMTDPTDYSFWEAKYKYNDELTQTFMSANLIQGFHSRLEGSRKFCFGNAAVYGKSNDSAIRGIYMVRGQDATPVFDVAPDAESYEFNKLDFAKDRKLIEQVWTWEGEFDGKPIAEGCAKTFK